MLSSSDDLTITLGSYSASLLCLESRVTILLLRSTAKSSAFLIDMFAFGTLRMRSFRHFLVRTRRALGETVTSQPSCSAVCAFATHSQVSPRVDQYLSRVALSRDANVVISAAPSQAHSAGLEIMVRQSVCSLQTSGFARFIRYMSNQLSEKPSFALHLC